MTLNLFFNSRIVMLMTSWLIAMTTIMTAMAVDVDISMPAVSPHMHDTYLCVPMKAGEVPSYITGFKPHTNTSIAHHMILYGCQEPFQTDKVWTCGEMAAKDSNTIQGPVCSKGPKIIYAWAMEAKSLQLPKDVAFKVGGDSDIKWVVLQVHYKDVTYFEPPSKNTDSSGITMMVSKHSKPKRAGVYLLSTDGAIPAKSTTFMEVACAYNGDDVIHPFAFRTHAHTHGEVSTGYRIRNGEWEEIGRMSPKVPEMFYNVSHPNMTIKKGDTLAARCTMVNNENRTVNIGQTTKDEMCNYYIMYWMEGDETLDRPYCASPGPPRWSWHNDPSLDFSKVPKDASLVPGSTKALVASVVSAAGVSRHPATLDASDHGYATGPFDGYKADQSSSSISVSQHLPREDDDEEEDEEERGEQQQEEGEEEDEDEVENEEEQLQRLREEEMEIERQEEADREVINNLDPEQQKELLMALEQLKVEEMEKDAEVGQPGFQDPHKQQLLDQEELDDVQNQQYQHQSHFQEPEINQAYDSYGSHPYDVYIP